MIQTLWHQFLDGSFWLPLAFLCAAAGTLLPGLMVVLSRNIVHSALWLLPCLVSVAALFVLLEAELLAGLQVLIYCGGIMVLILFAVMITQGVGDPDIRVHNNQLWYGLGGAVAFGAVMILLLSRQVWPAEAGPPPTEVTNRLADALLGPYVFAFEVASVALLVAMIGALVIARGEPKE